MNDYYSDNNLPSLNHMDLTTQTYRILREQILQRQLKPGEKIAIESVANSLGVSRTPVINALKLLEGDGLVEILPRRGTIVSQLTARDIKELFEIRLLIEIYAAEQLFASGRFDELLEEIEYYLDKMEKSVTEDKYVNYEEFITSDRDLHARLVDMVENHRLVNMYNELNIHMRIARAHYLETVQSALQAQEEHQAIAKSIRDQDFDGLKLALTEHINTVKGRILELLEMRGGHL